MGRAVYLITLICCFSLQGLSQNYPVGHRTITFTDAARGGRPIPSELYYPAVVAGENTALGSGVFPVIVFGHGFQMGFDSYFYFRDAIVPAGYILVFPKTETSLAPNHLEYGADLAFLVVQMKSEGTIPASPFFQHIDSTSAIMGHSMGGGASFLGCRNNTIPTAMVTWAAAETAPSAIGAARDITIPTLVFSAEKDCITPPALNQIPMYDSLSCNCKILVNILGGGHCYFADANFLCSLGEFGCPAFTITREQQHTTTLDFTKLFLDHYLKNQSGAWVAFNDSLNTSPRITFQKSCTTTSVFPVPSNAPIEVTPNPSKDITVISGNCAAKEPVHISVSDISGRNMFSHMHKPAENHYRLAVDMRSWKEGIYYAAINNSQESRVVKIIKK
ncbi:MAG: T9SS type A sorting domain-containing protein [Bacteroidales bacterium]